MAIKKKSNSVGRITARQVIKSEPRVTVRITSVENRTPYFKTQWERERRNLLSWK